MSEWTPEMRKAAGERMRARIAAMSSKQRKAFHEKQAADRAKAKPHCAPADAGAPPVSKVRARPAEQPHGCAGTCPFVDQVVERLLARLPGGEDREAQRVAVLALKMARTPSRDPRWYEAMTAVHRAATEWGEHHPAIRRQVDKGEPEP
jgi:hypothetical protein